MARPRLKLSKTELTRRKTRRMRKVRAARKVRPLRPNHALLLDETIASIAAEFISSDPLAAAWHHVTNGLRWAIIDRVIMEHIIAAHDAVGASDLAMLRLKLEQRLALLSYRADADY